MHESDSEAGSPFSSSCLVSWMSQVHGFSEAGRKRNHKTRQASMHNARLPELGSSGHTCISGISVQLSTVIADAGQQKQSADPSYLTLPVPFMS